jgi:hypothetical protein
MHDSRIPSDLLRCSRQHVVYNVLHLFSQVTTAYIERFPVQKTAIAREKLFRKHRRYQSLNPYVSLCILLAIVS